MAYTKVISVRLCSNSWCKRNATVEVFNHRNSSHGDYCRKCGNQVVKDLKKQEGEGYLFS